MSLEMKRPGGPIAEEHLFSEKVVDGKVKGFSDPENNWFDLKDGEELVHVKNESGSGRSTFIRTNGQDVPFEEWKKSYRK